MNDIINADSTNQTGTQTMQATQSPFDINALFSAAILNAVNAATAPLVARIELLERSLVVADKAAQGNEADLFSRIAALEARLDNITTASDERIREIADDAARMVFAEHNEEYDHYEIECQIERVDDKIEEKVSDAIDDYDFEDKVRDILRHASVNIDI